jgi:hypothetical protein
MADKDSSDPTESSEPERIYASLANWSEMTEEEKDAWALRLAEAIHEPKKPD